MKKVIGVMMLLASINSNALDCPAAKVLNVQPQVGSILFKLEGQDWHRLGKPGDPGVTEMYSALLAAHMAGTKVVVRYPDGYDCSAYDTGIPASMVRTYIN